MSSQPGNNCTAVRITEKARPAEARPEHGATERPFIICQRAARGRERTTRGQGFRRITSRNNSSMTASVVRASGGIMPTYAMGKISFIRILCLVVGCLHSTGIIWPCFDAYPLQGPFRFLSSSSSCCPLLSPGESSAHFILCCLQSHICLNMSGSTIHCPDGGVRVCKCIVPLQIEFHICLPYVIALWARRMLFCKIERRKSK